MWVGFPLPSPRCYMISLPLDWLPPETRAFWSMMLFNPQLEFEEMNFCLKSIRAKLYVIEKPQ